jgi:hypothetical protein
MVHPLTTVDGTWRLLTIFESAATVSANDSKADVFDRRT